MIITRVLAKVFDKEFYRLNAGFFLLTMGLAFGFMSGVEHMALAEFFVSSNVLILLPVTLWILYALKVIHFNTTAIHKSENIFLRTIVSLPVASTFVSVSITMLIQLFPVYAYGVFLILTGIKIKLNTTAPTILIAMISIQSIVTLKFFREIRGTSSELKPSRLKIWIDKTFQRSFSFMTLEWLLRTEFLSWFGTKLFSCLLLMGILRLYQFETYDYRLLAMGTTIAMTFNILLLNHLHKFENSVLGIYRNLPLPFLTRFINILIPMLIICLPELGLLSSHLQNDASFYIIIPFAVTLLIGYYGLLYWKDWGIEKSVQHAFFITLVLIFLILATIPLWILATGMAASGIAIWKIKYYRFEYTRTDSH